MKHIFTITVFLIIAVIGSAIVAGRQALAEEPATGEIQQQLEGLDLPILAGVTERTWTWGPAANTPLLNEPWVTSPLAQKGVQYFDKGRMVIEPPSGSLLNIAGPQTTYNIVNEMMAGSIATGDGLMVSHFSASATPVAGDPDTNNGPTYATLALLQDTDPLPEGTLITQRIDLSGSVREDQSLSSYGVQTGEASTATNHRVANVFWEFLNSSGVVWARGEFTDSILFVSRNDPFAITGQPVTEAYWTTVPVLGTEHDVLIQCFERRCMTYTPANPEPWQVEFNNAGQHYFNWRYMASAFGNPAELSPELLDLPSADIMTSTVTTRTLQLEVAESTQATRCGLMHRLTMPTDHGMLFVFDQERQGGFWNRNTFIPLTLAWIAPDGTIVDLTDMQAAVPGQPQDPITYTPTSPYQYVIEANQGWFSNRDIGIGDLVDLGPALQTGQTTDGSVCEALGF